MGRWRHRIRQESITAEISGLTHDGRGIALVEGRTLQIHGALPGEQVVCRYTGRRRGIDFGATREVIRPSEDRVAPGCTHFGTCSGCALQHYAGDQQIAFKHGILMATLADIAGVKPDQEYAPLKASPWHYRRKARLSVRWVEKKNRVLVGFRELNGRYVADLGECAILDKRIADQVPLLAGLVGSLDACKRIPQIEVACGDDQAALVFRNMDPLGEKDRQCLVDFAQSTGIAVFLQPAGPASITALEPHAVSLDYHFPRHDVRIKFGPADFIQINASLNHRMVDRVLELLQPGAGDSVLELFCGLGNFTLPMARYAAAVTGVEGDPELVEKARGNASDNGLQNVLFHQADLYGKEQDFAWEQAAYNKILIDPPRSGAAEVLPLIAATAAEQLVYVSCHPATLARDAGSLVHDHGFRLAGAGVMDMFPHTAHVESIVLFER